MLTPGLDGTDAGTVVRLREPSSVFMAATNSLYAAIPSSADEVAPSSYLPKIATMLSVLSSQSLLYSGNLPVVCEGLGASLADVVCTSAAAMLQPDARGR
jgi:hypothetical protein